MKQFILLGLMVSFFICAGVAQAQEFKAGKWEMTMVTKVEGMDEQMRQAQEAMKNMSPEQKAMMEKMMGGMNMKMDITDEGMTTTIIQCLTEQNPIPKMDESTGCEVDHNKKGNKVEFEMTCPQSASKGSMIFKDTTVKGNIKSEQMMGGKKTSTNVKLDGKFLGPCDE